MMERRFSRTGRPGALAVVVFAILLLHGSSLWAGDGNLPSGAVDYRWISLDHITPEQGRGFLTRLRIGTVSTIPTTNRLLITGRADELRKAVAIMDVVDAPQQYEIKELMPATSVSRLPSNDRIAEAVGGLCIGTFGDPPRGSKVKALIDVHDGAVVAIAPVFQLQDIKRAVDLGPQALKLRGYESLYPTVGLAAHTLQATDTAEPSASEGRESEGQDAADKTPASEADPAGSGRITLPKEMQEKLEELKRRAAEMQGSQQPVSNAETSPGASAGTEREPTSPDSSLGRSRGAVAPGIPEGFEMVGDEPQVAPEPLRPLDAGLGETTPLVPGQIIPSESERITARPEEPAEEMTTIDVADLLAQTAESAPSYEPAAFPNGEQTIDLALPERLPVIQLLDLVGKYLGLSYVYDPAKVTGEVTLKLNGNLRGSMKVKDLYVLLESVLQFKELVMTRHKGNIVKIVPKLEALNADPQLVTPDGPTIEAGDAVVTRVIELKYIDNSSAENFLQQMGLAVGVTSIVESKTLIVTAYAHRMKRIEQLLHMVDIPGEPRKFRFRQLKYTMAQTLAEKVKALAEQLESITVTVGEATAAAPTTARLPGESEAAYRTRVARLKAAQAAAAARARATQGGSQATEPQAGVYLDADERTNRVLMIGVVEQLAVVDELIDALDVEQQDLRSLQLYRIRHVDAEEVSRKLYELGVITKVPETPGSDRITSRIARTTPGQPPRPATPTPEVPLPGETTEGGLGGEPQVVVVESTNSLLVNATAEQHEQIATIIEYVDSEMLQDEVPYKIYPLENSSPAHLAEVLESLIQETIEQDREGKIEKTVVSREEKIRIVPDPNTYSLIVYAKKKNQDWIANLVQQLDRRRPQVLIDVTLVEVTKSDAFTYDLNVVRNFSDNDDLKDGRDPNSVLEKFMKWGSGSLSAFYVDKQIDALLTAVQSKNYGRVLAKPKLLVNDNEQGIIETKDITYVEVSSSIPVASGAGGVQTDLIQTSVNFEPYEAGIKLDITPHISEGDLLRLDIVLTRSDFLKTAAVGERQKPPNTRENQVDTAVTLPDGSTVILGGLLKMNQNKGGGKVPILGDIPVLGGLFRSVDNSDEQSKLYVFVKAEIIRPAETITHGMKDLEVISERNRVAFERHELEFQRHESWPGIEPAPIDPPKVLEAH